jgi:hypothetical protein
LIDRGDKTQERSGDVFVFVMDQVELPCHGRIEQGNRPERSPFYLLARHPAGDAGDAQPFFDSGLDRLVAFI